MGHQRGWMQFRSATYRSPISLWMRKKKKSRCLKAVYPTTRRPLRGKTRKGEGVRGRWDEKTVDGGVEPLVGHIQAPWNGRSDFVVVLGLVDDPVLRANKDPTRSYIERSGS